MPQADAYSKSSAGAGLALGAGEAGVRPVLERELRRLVQVLVG